MNENPASDSPRPGHLRPLDRWPYFWMGFALLTVKYNLDRLVAHDLFRRNWYFWNYIKPHDFAPLDALPPEDARFFIILLLTSLPFLAVGLYLTLRRLRSAGLPLTLCLIFFLPVLNLVFFAALSVIPSHEGRKTDHLGAINQPRWLRWLPHSAGGSAVASAVLVGLAGVGIAFLSASVMQNYGWGLFVALPFAMGLVSVLLFAGRQERSFKSCMAAAVLPIAFAGLCLLAAAVEGAICLLMAAPIALVLALFGGWVGYMIVRNRSHRLHPAAAMLILLSAPFTTGMERMAGIEPPLLSVTTSVEIDAPPERVWPNVIAFSPITEPRDWILRTGIAYPTRARIFGSGVGAIRHCIFSTGEFVEPVTVWEENRLLAFNVDYQPEPMLELSPYPKLKAPHLHGYLASRHGELRLTPLEGGRTRLSGTTWYTDRVWPSRYWQLWSDMIIHHIHLRVLNHIRLQSEQATVPIAS